eukprot:XP_001704841.1 Hypothetical protein GL50803_24681 [Giardia lamblia ATCC 50803]
MNKNAKIGTYVKKKRLQRPRKAQLYTLTRGDEPMQQRPHCHKLYHYQ